jgi:hypothetical protein
VGRHDNDVFDEFLIAPYLYDEFQVATLIRFPRVEGERRLSVSETHRQTAAGERLLERYAASLKWKYLGAASRPWEPVPLDPPPPPPVFRPTPFELFDHWIGQKLKRNRSA